ncbi:MAG: ABC transporter permease [Prevotella sp.]|nr:ABC transporter permease [Prevotella sp.]
MYLGEFSLWGVVAVAFLLGVALMLVWLVDRKVLLKALRVNVKSRLPRLSAAMWLVSAGSAIVAGAAVSAALMLCLPCRTFPVVLAVVLLCLLIAVPRSMETYHRSLSRTKAHRKYLIANGASQLESVIPSVRRALRTSLLCVLWTRSTGMLLAMVLMFCGLILGGATVAAALLLTLAVWAATVAAAVLGSVLAMWLYSYRMLRAG